LIAAVAGFANPVRNLGMMGLHRLLHWQREGIRAASRQRMPSLKKNSPNLTKHHAARSRALEQSLCPLIETGIATAQQHRSNPRMKEPKQLAELSRCLREAATMRVNACWHWRPWRKQSDELARGFCLLFDPARDLFSVGYNVTEHRRDTASMTCWPREARLCSYVLQRAGQVPQNHWFSMGRLLVTSRASPSWFRGALDVRIPDAVAGHASTMRTPCSTTPARRRCRQQIEYGDCACAMGISEIGLTTARMFSLNYQYPRFACRAWALKRGCRGLGESLLTPRHGADGCARGGL